MNTIISRLKGQTPYFFRIIGRIATAGIAICGAVLGLDQSPFGPVPHFWHDIARDGGMIATVVVFMAHLVTTKESQSPN